VNPSNGPANAAGGRAAEAASDLIHVKTPGHPDDADAQSGLSGLTTGGPTRRRLPADSRPQRWYTLAEAADLCLRKQGTIRNVLSLHQLPRRLGWTVRNRHRNRAILLSAATVAELQRLTLLRPVRRKA
jgi:hypothetical protein